MYTMKTAFAAGSLAVALALIPSAPSLSAQNPEMQYRRAPGGVPSKATFLQLGNNANAVLVEPVTLNEKSRIVVIRTHPEHIIT